MSLHPSDEHGEQAVGAAESEATPAESTGNGEQDWAAEAQRLRDQYLRAAADMENMKKRLEREKTDFIRLANEGLIRDLLPQLDNLERALSHAGNAGASLGGFVEGVRLTYEGVMSVLTRFGVKPVVAAGTRFDPNVHEAVMQREDPDVENGSVLEEVQKGYFLHDRLLRPAMVVVSRRPAAENID